MMGRYQTNYWQKEETMSLDEKKLDMLQEWIVKYCGMSYKKVSISTKGAYIEYE